SFPAALFLRLQVWRRRKNLAGKSPPPDSDPFYGGGVLRESRRSVNTIRHKRELPIQVPETLSVSHPRAQRNAFRRRDARPQSKSFAPENQRLGKSRSFMTTSR